MFDYEEMTDQELTDLEQKIFIKLHEELSRMHFQSVMDLVSINIELKKRLK